MKEPDPRPLGFVGCGLLGAGLAMRLLVSESSGAMASSVPPILLIAGAAVTLLERAMRGGATFRPWLLALPLVLIPGFFPLESTTVARGCDFIAAILAGLALRDLVLGDGLAGPLMRVLVAVTLFLCVLGVTQTLYQRGIAHDAAARSDVVPSSMWTDPQAEAFLASRRAPASFVNPNVFGGFLVLVIPLLVLAARTRGRAVTVCALAGGSFVCAGSAGATVALLLATATLLVFRPTGRLRLLGIAGATGGAAAVCLITLALVVPSALPGLLAEKAATFRERLGYHETAFSLFGEAGFTGLGWESYGIHARAAITPDESWSHYAHDAYVQGLLEGGPIVLLLLVPLVLVLRGLYRHAPSPLPEAGAGGVARVFLPGALLGTAAAPWLSPSLTLVPLDQPLADVGVVTMITTVGLVWGFHALCGRLSPSCEALRRALTVGVVALLVHAWLDFDLYAPGVSLALGSVLALVPRRAGEGARPLGGGARVAWGAAALIMLALPLLVGRVAMQRDAVQAARAGGHDDVLIAAARDVIPTAEAIGPALADLTRRIRASESEAILAALPAALRTRLDVRRAEAWYLAERALRGPVFAPEALERLGGLLRPGESEEWWILAQRLRIEHALKLPGAKRTRERLRATAATWGIPPANNPYRSLLRGH